MPQTHIGNMSLANDVGSISQSMIAMPKGGRILQSIIVMPQVKSMVVKPQVESISQCMVSKPQVWSTSQNMKHPKVFLPMSTVAFQPKGSQNLTKSSPIISVVSSESVSIKKQPRIAVDSFPSKVLETSDLDSNDDCVSVVNLDDNKKDSDDDKIESDVLKCPDCESCFSKEIELLNHEEMHIGEVNYVCEDCGKEFGIKRYFELHVRTHEMEKKFECEFCYKKFDYRDNLLFHIRIHRGIKSFKCHICDKKFDNKFIRDRHVLKHPPPKVTFSGNWLIKENQTNQSNSSQLGSAFRGNQSTSVAGVSQENSLVVLGAHQNPVPKNIWQNFLDEDTDQFSAGNLQKSLIRDIQNSEAVAKGSKSDVSVYICYDCKKGFPDKVSLDNHMRKHKKDKVEPKTQQGKCVKPEMKYICPKCKKIYFTHHFFKIHLSLCDKDDMNMDVVNCAFCKKNYKLPKQDRDCSNQSFKFICEPCCTFLAQKSQVSGFMPRLEDRLICNKCDMCFANVEQLRKHHDSHLKAYECSKCKKQFMSDKALQEHMECHFAEKIKTSFSDRKKKNIISHFLGGNEKDKSRKHSIKVVKNSNPDNLEFKKKMDISPPRSSKRKVVKFSGREFGKQKKQRGSRSSSEDEESLQELGKESPIPISHARPGIDRLRQSPKLIADLSSAFGKKHNCNYSYGAENRHIEKLSSHKGTSTDLGMEISMEKDYNKSDSERFENVTVFNPTSFSSLSWKEATTSFGCPDNVIKQGIANSSHDDLLSTIKIKEENISEDLAIIQEKLGMVSTMKIKEENISEDEVIMEEKLSMVSTMKIKEENVSEDEVDIKEEPEIVSLGFTIKEEEMDDSENELLMHEDFEFKAFGGPMKMESVFSS